MNIGFIGFGEAAYNISLGLHSEGSDPIRAFDNMANDAVFGERVQTRAKEAGVTLVDSYKTLAESSDLIIVPIPPAFSLDAAKSIAPFMRPGQVYADVSGATPDEKKAIADVLAEHGVLFADGAMLGALAKYQHRVPIVTSGSGAAAFAEYMNPRGMKIRVVEGGPGAASAIKLVRSIFMKGIAALMIDTMQAADAYDVSDEIVASLSKSLDGIPFVSHLDRIVTGTALHCTRRAAELKGSVAMQEEAGLNPEMTLASKHGHEALEKYEFAKRYVGSKPSGWQEIIEAIRVVK